MSFKVQSTTDAVEEEEEENAVELQVVCAQEEKNPHTNSSKQDWNGFDRQVQFLTSPWEL